MKIRSIREDIRANQNTFCQIRRDLHQIPELGFEEKKTTAYLVEALRKIGLEALPLEPTGVVAYIGPKDAPVYALRADIDALAIREETGLPFASLHEGRMHACGHDGHMAGLLGAARILKNMENELTIRVKLIFQPSEENTMGAKHIIQAGVLEDVKAIFGLHLFSDIPYGTLSVESGPRMAQTDRFTITFRGVGGHAGKPHLCVDSTVMAAEFVLSAQTIVAREINPVEPAVVTIGSFHSGTQYNIISPEAVLRGTCRSFSADTAKKLKESIERKAQAIATSYGATVEIDYDLGSHPPVINEESLSLEILAMAKEILPEKNFASIPPLMLGEDFSWYQDRIPGVFAFVGCGMKEGISYPNHHPQFDIEEESLEDAVALYMAAVRAFIERVGREE